ncbi:MAG TPA: protein-glutamate O-methyltransferase CheR [Chloroflexota bacterium]|jgi:chemotaxis protein methyltransferase CheR
MLQSPPATTTSAEPGVTPDFELFRKRAYQITGLDLTSYKAPQMHRRLMALLSRLQVADFTAYARLLERDGERRQEFRDYVTINVSEFFRDSDRFGDLERKILPMLLESSTAGVKVWSAGCSIGAEPYSMSIILRELAPARTHSILATDIDQTILDRARGGRDYLASDIRNVGTGRMAKWFTPQPDGRYSVGAQPRTMITFQKHDLLRDRYPSGPFDLVSCRNVVIYFTEEAKERIYQGFVNSLRTGGILFVGGTEAIMRPQALGLKVVGPGFYRKEPV